MHTSSWAAASARINASSSFYNCLARRSDACKYNEKTEHQVNTLTAALLRPLSAPHCTQCTDQDRHATAQRKQVHTSSMRLASSEVSMRRLMFRTSPSLFTPPRCCSLWSLRLRMEGTCRHERNM